MDDEKANKGGDEPRERILATVTYADIELPTAGAIRVHPYISDGAIDAYGDHPSNAKAAFLALVTASTEQKKPIELVDEDADVIARLYAEKEGFLARYLHERATTDSFHAFDRALKESKLWRDRAESLRQIEEYLEKQTRFIERITALPPGVESALQSLNRQLAAIPKFTVPEIRFPDLSALIGSRFHAFETVSMIAQQNAFAMDRATRITTEALGRCNDVALGLSRLPDYGLLLREHTTYIQRLSERTLAADSFLKSHADVFSSFERLAATVRLPNLPLLETADLVARAFTGSDALVRSAGAFFRRPTPTRPALAELPVPLPEVRRVLEAEADIEEVTEETEILVHGTAGEVLLAGNEVLVGLKELLSGVIDERLGPLAPFLERLRLLANPAGFFDLLKSFARHFQRDHWKSLWAEEGQAFKPKPESIAQMALSLFLQGQFGGMAFVGRELGNGDGFVDVLVNFLGLDYVVEVKIIGTSWSIGSAKSGLDQLDAYVQNYDAASAFLIVFDGRRSERGEQLESEYLLKSGASAHVIVVRSYFEAPSKRP